MYYFQEQYNKRIESIQNEQQSTIFKAKQERFNSNNHVDILKNRMKHLEQQQTQTSLKIQQQNERTIQIIKKKFENEQQRHQKKIRNKDDEKGLEQLKQKVKSQRIRLESDGKMNQQKLLIQKQNRHRQIKYEDLKNELQVKDIRYKMYQDKQDRANSVRDIIEQTRINIENYWDRKTTEYETLRNYSIAEQELIKTQEDIKYKQLGQKEQVLLQQFRNTMGQQDQSTNQLNSIKSMSTRQFREKYPEFYNKVINEVSHSKSDKNKNESGIQTKKQKIIQMNRELQDVYMVNQNNNKVKQ